MERLRMRGRLTLVLSCMLTAVAAGLSGCAGGTEQFGDRSVPPSTDQTSRESYDEFMAQLNQIVAVTGETTGWAAEYGQPWPLEPDYMMIPGPCDPKNWRTSPHQISLHLLGPGTDDPQADRDAMIRYMEDQGLEISGVFGDPSYPEGVAWDATGRGENGLKIIYATSSTHRGITLHGECSSHPSMQNKVSRDAP